jgi:hypothetical protein
VTYYRNEIDHAWAIGGHICDWSTHQLTQLAALIKRERRLPGWLVDAQAQIDEPEISRQKLLSELERERFGYFREAV